MSIDEYTRSYSMDKYIEKYVVAIRYPAWKDVVDIWHPTLGLLFWYRRILEKLFRITVSYYNTGYWLGPVLRIQTLLIRIWMRLFYPDPDLYRFKEVMYLKQFFLYIFTSLSLSVGPTGPTQKVFFVQFSLPVNFVVLMRVAYGSGS
jgi:hypothetical protein